MIDDTQALSRLHELALAPTDGTDIEPLLRQILDVAIALTEADFGNLQLVDPVSGDLAIAVQRGFHPWWIEFWNQAGKGHGVCGSALEAGARIVIEDVASSPVFVGTPALEVQLRAGVRAVQSTPLMTRQGKVVGMVSTHFRSPRRLEGRSLRWLDMLARQAADLIEGWRAAVALQHSEASFQTLVSAGWDLVYRADAAWSAVQFPGDMEFAGNAASPCSDWLDRYIAAADRPRVQQAIHEAIRTKAGFSIEHGVQWPDGSRGWAHTRVMPVRDGDGQVVEWLGAARDLTQARRAAAARDEARERLHALLQALPVGVVFAHTPDCERVIGNAAMRAMFGVGADDNLSASAASADAIGRRIRYFQAGEPVAAEDLPLQRAAREARKVGPVELDVALPGGDTLFIEVTAVPLLDAHAQAIGAVGILVDVMERRRAEEAIEQVRVKDEFLAVLSHELRNPLAAISSAADELRDDKTPDEREAMRTLIRRQVDVLTRLAEDLADVSRIANGQLRLNLEPVSLSELMKAAVAVAQPAADKRAQQLVVQAPATDVVFQGDRVRLLQIVVNLLDNASKYTGQGGRIRLTGGLEGQDVVMRCSDNGHGIEPQMLQRIFEPLVRGPAAKLAAPGGLGLGLTLIQRLARLHGGSASAHSSGKGHGSEFVVRLPFVDASRRPPAAASATPARPVDPVLTTLLVEDHPDVAAATVEQLRSEGLQVVAAASGQAALEAAAAQRPRLLLCDLSLPDMSGLQLIDALKPQLAAWGTHVVVLTGRSDAEIGAYARRASELGVDEFIAKPLRVEWLHRLRERLRRN